MQGKLFLLSACALTIAASGASASADVHVDTQDSTQESCSEWTSTWGNGGNGTYENSTSSGSSAHRYCEHREQRTGAAVSHEGSEVASAGADRRVSSQDASYQGTWHESCGSPKPNRTCTPAHGSWTFADSRRSGADGAEVSTAATGGRRVDTSWCGQYEREEAHRSDADDNSWSHTFEGRHASMSCEQGVRTGGTTVVASSCASSSRDWHPTGRAPDGANGTYAYDQRMWESSFNCRQGAFVERDDGAGHWTSLYAGDYRSWSYGCADGTAGSWCDERQEHAVIAGFASQDGGRGVFLVLP